MNNIERIKRKNISDEVYEQLLKNISEQVWLPGSQLPSENDLAAMFGVSRVSVRTAIQKLTALGLLEAKNGEGTFVKRLNATMYLTPLLPMFVLKCQDIIEVLELRMGIEIISCRLAAERATPEDIEMLEKIFEQWKQSNQAKDVYKFASDDLDFHICIAKISRNSMIEHVLTTLKQPILIHLTEMIKRIGFELNVDMHYNIVQAIKEKDSEAATFYISHALKKSIERLREYDEVGH